MSLFSEINLVCQKFIKNEKLPGILRWHATLTLRKNLEIGARSLNDSPGKDLLKILKFGLMDKSGSVSRGCAEVSERSKLEPMKLVKFMTYSASPSLSTVHSHFIISNNFTLNTSRNRVSSSNWIQSFRIKHVRLSN